MKSFIKGVSILVILGLLGGIAGCATENQAGDTVRLKKVKTLRVTVDNITIFTELAGNIKAKEEAGVVPIYPGIVDKITVKPGDMVKKGDVLFVIASSNINNEYRQAQSKVLEAMENYSEIKKQYARNLALFSAGGIAQAELDSLTAKLKIADTQIEQSQAAAEILRNNLEGTSVKAPISGTVALKNINIGDFASDSAAAMQIADLSSLGAEFGVGEEMVGRLKQGQEISLQVPSMGKQLKGKVASISPIMNMETHQYKIIIIIVDQDSLARPGMLAKMRLTAQEKKEVMVLPNQAIISNKGINYVYCIIDDKIKKTLVETGIADENSTEIIKGLKEGQLVAVEGLSFLSDDEQVEIIK